jgi:H+/Cl- antiporter ClcA
MPPITVNYRENAALLRTLVKWGALGAWVGVISGAASALFLHALDWATATRDGHPSLLYLLPVAGLVIGGVYDRYGQSVAGGNNLLLERIHSEETTAIPFRMVPLVLIGTVVTHLFGGSAGREGTAVQMGGTLANLATKPLKLSPRDHRLLIMSGISGGFGSVFGTPLAGAVFGMEVLSIGRIDYEALVPCVVASIVGDAVCRALGVHHHAYSVRVLVPPLTPLLALLTIVAGALFAGAAAIFSELTHAIAHFMKERVKAPALRPVLGGIAIIALTSLVGTRDYLGLSLPLIDRSFTPEGVALWAFALKILFTAVTLGTGFKGGEVTPLFCIGATLGAAFAHLTGQPTGFFAALGFAAVFAGAANTPLACTLLGIELFGSPMAVPLFVSCVVAYILSGHRGIYQSQRVGTPKSLGIAIADGIMLRDVHGKMRLHVRRNRER